MKYQMIVSDFDWTLGKSPNQIPEPTKQAIKQFQDKGGVFVIVTGRTYFSIKEICKFHNITGPIACCQGSYIADLETDKPLHHTGLNKDQAVKIYKTLKKDNFETVVAVVGNKVHAEDEQAYHHFGRVNNAPCVEHESLLEFLEKNNEPVCVMFAIVEEEKRYPSIDRYSKLLNGYGITVNSGTHHILEFANSTSTKGSAVRKLAQIYGISLDKVMAVGDSTNDIALIDGEWHGVAVGNAVDELKQVAKEVTVHYDQMPIKHLIEKYCL